MAEISAILVIAHRDLVKLLRDRLRILADFALPLILVLLLGPTLQAGFGEAGGIDITTFVFTGVLAQSVWQSSSMGIISLIADREEDFSQEIFVSPISRYSIVAGNRYEWKAGDLMLSAPGWVVHNHASYDDYVYELTVQDQPLNIFMESLLWQEDLKRPPEVLGATGGFATNRAVQEVGSK